MGENLSNQILDEEKIFDSISDWISIIDLDLKIKYTNKAGIKLLGLKKDEILNQSCCKLIHNSKNPIKNCPFKKMLKSKRNEKSEIFIKEKNRWYSINADPIIDKDKKITGAVHIVRDITDIKILDIELKKSERELRNIIKNSLDVVYRLNLKTGTYDYASPASQELFGISADELISLGFEKASLIVHPDDRLRLKDHFEKLINHTIEQNYSPTIEYRILHKTKGYRWVSDTRKVLYTEKNKPVAIVGSVKDIENPKKVERELRESKEQLNAIVNHSFDFMMIYNLDDNKLLWSNNRWKEVLGWSPKTIKDPLEPCHPEDRKKVLKAFSDIYENKIKEINDLESRYKTIKGDYKDFTSNILKIKIEDKEVLFIDAHEITDLKKKEKELRESNSRYERIVNNSPDLIAEADENGNFLSVNPSMAKSLGYKIDDLIGKNIFDIFPKNIAKKRANIGKKALNNGKIYTSEDYRNGRYFYNTYIPSIDINGKKIIQLIARDVTKQKLKEKEIQKSLLKYDLDEGNCYLIAENYLNKSIIVFNDLLKFGYKGYVFSRIKQKEIKKQIKYDFIYYFLTDRSLPGSVEPSSLKKLIDEIDSYSVFLIDRFDYIIQKISFKKVIDFVQYLNEIAYIKNHIILITIDPKIISEKILNQISKETKFLEPKQKLKIDDEQLKILKFVFEKNIIDEKPNYSDIEYLLQVSKPTARNKIRELRNKGYLTENLIGRRKTLEITERSRNIFL